MEYDEAIDIFDNNICMFDYDKKDYMEEAIDRKIEKLEFKLNKLKEARKIIFSK